MRKALRIIAVFAGTVSVVSVVILGFIYFEDISGRLNVFKNKIFDKISEKNNRSKDITTNDD